MLRNKKFIIGIAIVCVLIIILIFAFIVSSINKQAQINYVESLESAQNSFSEEAKMMLKLQNSDISLGNKNAPVQIISYDSYSCVHCAKFFSVIFPLIEENYIKTGKVIFIHREFPLDVTALTATKLMKCFFKKNPNQEKAFNLIAGIYETQKDWGGSEDYQEKLTQIFEFANFSKKDSENCLKNEELENQILEERLQSSKVLKIMATPTFFINGERLNGDYSYKNFESIIENTLNEK
jgi:protein-disulfide isomerase